MKNVIGREVPEQLSYYGKLKPFGGAFAVQPKGGKHSAPVKAVRPGDTKLLPNLEAVFKAAQIRDGMTFSFHHHLRNGDAVLNMVLETASRLGLKDLRIATTSLHPVHAPLAEHIRSGVVTRVEADFIVGPVAQAISSGQLPHAAILRTHGGRPRAIETGEVKIDVTFIAAPTADPYGNLNGVEGPSACGPLGYSFTDAQYADIVIAVTDNLKPYPISPISIPETLVDYVVTVDCIGDPNGIASGTIRMTTDPVDLKIAEMAALVIQASGLLTDGFSFQTGAGGSSLASAAFVRKLMREAKVKGSFLLGGIGTYMVDMLEEGLFETALDIQSFDKKAIRSLARDKNHVEIGASHYANPFTCGCAVNHLKAGVLGATEIDLDFNVNVITGSSGLIMGGSGGHSDIAAGAELSIITTKLVRKQWPIIVDRVLTVTTPGETIDCVVTEHGIAVNPRKPELADRIVDAGLPLKSIEELRAMALAITGPSEPVRLEEKIVALVEYRDGTAIDIVRQMSA